MKTILFYFSATGNSLTTAWMLAKEWNECELVPLASLNTQEEIVVQADTIGFIFPIYYSDMPYIMRQAISKMHFINTPYIFSICTCRGHYGNIAQRLNALLQERNQFLSLSRHICLPGNSRISSLEQNVVMLALQRENVHTIAQELINRPVEKYDSETIITPSPVHHASNMRGMEAEEICIGCGICEKICPMENITLTDGKPKFGENCSSCLACFHWCPKEAIWMSKGEKEIQHRFKYHHPEVSLKDILNQKNKTSK